MPSIITKQIIIGHYDHDGYAYCLKHSRIGMEEIYSDNTLSEKCSVCGAELNDLSRSN